MKQPQRIFNRIFLYIKLSLQRHHEGHLPIWRQFLEIFGVAMLTRNGPSFYHMAGLYRRSIPWREKLQRLGSREYQNRIRKLNPDYYKTISQNKLSEKGLLQLLGYPTPRFIGHLHPSFGQTHDGSPLRTANDLTKLLKNEDFTKVCFKLLEGCGNNGFETIEVLKDTDKKFWRRVKTGNIVTMEQFYDDVVRVDPINGILIEDYFVQHPTLAAFNPQSVNTCCVWVLAIEKMAPRSVLGYLRMGRAGSLVDNESNGGIVAPIDLETGITRKAIDGLPDRREFLTHPDHGAPIVGQKLPYWKEVKALAESCLASFPGIGFAGLEIGVSPTGPAILEMNVQPDREGAAFVDIPSGHLLPR